MALINSNRSRFLLGCGATALTVAMAMAPERVHAQAFQATPTVVQGSVTIDRGIPGQDLIEVATPTAVIDWVPQEDVAGNALTFLPFGNTASYYDAPGQGGFAVLNRILPATNGNVVEINGTVISNLQTAPGVFQAGGFVAFYSPTGFLIGSTALFDVGNLMLTTLEPSLTSFDAFANSGGPLDLTGITGSTAGITINPGATISATPENSFFIAAGSQVNVFGNVAVNGTHAYVAAEQATLTYNSGLFDIVIPVGTNVGGTVINLDGNIGGPSSTGAGDNHLIYAVAQAAANPIQMLFSGNLGFAPAASAGIVNGEIILSANYDVFGRSVNGGTITDGTLARFTARSERSTTQANITVTDAVISSSTLAIGTHTTLVTAQTGPASVSGNLQVIGRQIANLTSANGQTFLITGDALVASDDAGVISSSLFDPTAINASGGVALVDATGGGTISINGNAVVSADAFSGAETIGLLGGSATAGQAQLGATGGTLNIAGEAVVSARAESAPIAGLTDAGAMDAGLAQIFSNSGGVVNITGNATVEATAIGTNTSAGSVSAGGAANGGGAFVNVIGGAGAITFGADVLLDASAVGGDGNASTIGTTTPGGEAAFNTQAAGASIDVAGDVTLLAEAFGNRNFNGLGGDARGGIARLGSLQGTIVIDGTYQSSANAFGGQGTDGGNGLGGISGVFADRGSVTVGEVQARASGTGGAADLGGRGGFGQGGLAFLDAGRSAISTATLTILGNAVVESFGFGGIGGSGGAGIAAGQGGDAVGGAFGTLNPVDSTFNNGAYALAQYDYGTLVVAGDLVVRSDGRGGTGGLGDAGELGGAGGNGTGGTAQAGLYMGLANAGIGLGSSDFANTFLTAQGIGGAGGISLSSTLPSGAGGSGAGGVAFVSAPVGNVDVASSNFDARGQGGAGGTGGNATGGSAGFEMTAGGDVTALSTDVIAAAFGGNSTNGAAGAATGGLAVVNLVSGTFQMTGSLLASASATGGIAIGGAGGNATGGSAGVVAASGTAGFTGNVRLRSDSVGGNSSTANGGTAIGGRARASTSGGQINIGTFFSTSAEAVGGNGTNGGNATGGIAGAFAGTGSIAIADVVSASTRAVGGNATVGFGGQGGSGTGGNAFVQANGTLTTNASITVGTGINVFADGTGGLGGGSNGSTIAAGAGGAGLGGSLATANAADPAFNNGAFVLAQGDRGTVTTTGPVQATAIGTGGQGGVTPGTGTGGAGGAGTGGTAQAGMFIGTGNGSVAQGVVQFGSTIARATGIGGLGGLNAALNAVTGTGGAGQGGGAFFTARLASTTATGVTVEADGNGGLGGAGGAGTGGDAALLVTNGGSAALSSLSASSVGRGGAGLLATGGAGTGGDAFIGFHGGAVTITGDATIVADGFGGQSHNADGAIGTGGIADIATFTAISGTASIGGGALLSANGFGGEAASTGFTGGTGTGGEAYLLTQVGGTLQAGSARVIASGQGGSGPSAKGGAGNGGRAYIEARDSGSTVSIANTTTINAGNAFTQNAFLGAMGIGGQTTGADGIGGTGTGGVFDVLATGGGSVSLPLTGGPTGFVRLLARGQGGNSSVDGGTGGLGIGGTGTINVDGGTLVGGPLLPSVFGLGGSSSSPAANINGGDGRDGERRIIVQNGGVLTASLPGGVAGGIGGNATGTGAGGNGSGGIATLQVTGGTANLRGASIIAAQVSGGNAEAGNAGSATSGAAGVTVSGGGVINIQPDASGEAVLQVDANTFGGTSVSGSGGNATAAGSGSFTIQPGGAVNGGALVVTANAIGGSSTSGAGGNAASGQAQFLANGNTSSLSALTVESTATGGQSVSGLNGSAQGQFAVLRVLGSTLNVSGLVRVSGRATTGTDPSTGLTTTATGGNATASDALIGVLVGTLNAGQIELVSDATAFQNGSATAARAALGLTSARATALGTLSLSADATSNGGGTATAGAVTLEVLRNSPALPAAAQQTSVLTSATLAISSEATGATTNTAGLAELTAQGSRADITNMTVSSLGANGSGGLNWSAVDGSTFAIIGTAEVNVRGPVAINTATSSIIGGPTVTAPTANIFITTPGTITIDGDNDNAISFGGQSLTLESSELDILDGARIGGEFVELVSNNVSHTAIIGGTTEEPGYTLTAAEAEKIEVGQFSFFGSVIDSSDPNTPDLILRDITASGSDGDGTSRIEIEVNIDSLGRQAGIIRVEGEVAYLDTTATDELEFEAGERIEIVTPGGVAVLGSGGIVGGNLRLEAPSIWAADADTIAQLQADSSFAGRNDLLATVADGSNDPLGYIRGGSVVIDAARSVLVRNTGTSEEQGGITVGAGGLSIAADPELLGLSSAEPLDVFAYGRQQNADGSFITGASFYELVNFNRTDPDFPTSYIAGSKFNDCDIVTGDCPNNTEEIIQMSPPVNNPVVLDSPVSDPVAPPPSEEESSAEFGVDFPGLVEASPIQDQGSFDDGVMSGGDSSLYSVADDAEASDDEENEDGE